MMLSLARNEKNVEVQLRLCWVRCLKKNATFRIGSLGLAHSG